MKSKNIGGTVIVITIILSIFTFILFKSIDTDFWWHLKTGEYIVNTHSIPHTNIFSYTDPTHLWIVQEWLTESIIYIINYYFGFLGNSIFFSLIFVTLSLIVLITCIKRSRNYFLSTITLTLTVSTLFYFAGLRPQMITWLFFALINLLLIKYPISHKAWLIITPIFFIIWINLHAGWPIGLTLLIFSYIFHLITSLKDKLKPSLTFIYGLGISIGMMILLNPNGLSGFLYPFSYLLPHNYSINEIVEWQSPNLHLTVFYLFLISIFLIIVVKGYKQDEYQENILLAFFLLLALVSQRNIPFFMIILAPILTERYELIYRKYKLVFDDISNIYTPLVTLLCISCLIVFIAYSASNLEEGVNWGSASIEDNFPVGTANYILQHNLQGNILNFYSYGGYLIYRLYPVQKVFIDGRADPYSNKTFNSYDTFNSLNLSWRNTLNTYNISLILIPKGSAQDTILAETSGWKLIDSDKVSVLFQRITK